MREWPVELTAQKRRLSTQNVMPQEPESFPKGLKLQLVKDVALYLHTVNGQYKKSVKLSLFSELTFLLTYFSSRRSCCSLDKLSMYYHLMTVETAFQKSFYLALHSVTKLCHNPYIHSTRHE